MVDSPLMATNRPKWGRKLAISAPVSGHFAPERHGDILSVSVPAQMQVN
jgi:hypothetical protein